MSSLFALVDCNNFYVSCERIFRPDLWKKPVVVLSSNDGCVISRSKEAKSLFIPMGVPFFKIKDSIQTHNIEVFSSNFLLYADISRRFFETISLFSQNTEIYSVDELFLEFFKADEDFQNLGDIMRNMVLKNLGLPISIGFSITKTLSKIANHWAKKEKSFKGICILRTESEILDALRTLPIAEVWGIGKRLSSKLNALGIKSAFDLAQTNPKQMRSLHSVQLEKTVHELRGQPCFSLEKSPPSPKSIQISRSFGVSRTSLEDIQGAISAFCEHASQKLRQHHLHTHGAYLYLGTRTKKTGKIAYSSAFIEFPTGIQDPCSLVKAVLKAFNSIFKKETSYSKMMLLLVELESPRKQISLWTTPLPKHTERDSLFRAVDKIQTKFGKNAIKLASSLPIGWKPKSQQRSPLYTLKWHDLPIVKAI